MNLKKSYDVVKHQMKQFKNQVEDIDFLNSSITEEDCDRCINKSYDKLTIEPSIVNEFDEGLNQYFATLKPFTAYMLLVEPRSEVDRIKDIME